MTPDFVARILGMVILAVAGARLGTEVGPFLNLNSSASAIMGVLIGMLVGLVATPYFTTRPVRALRRLINELPVERLLMSLLGGLVGLLLALLLAYPLSLLPIPLGTGLPGIVSVIGAYLGITTFGIRHREILDAFSERFIRTGSRMTTGTARKLVLDTSVLIDGRIEKVVETGFLGGTLIIPRFVMNELHRVADSSDQLRRNRGKHGLDVLKRIQRSETVPIRMVEEDFDDIPEVDDKLVAIALQMGAAIVTNDYNLGQVADIQGVEVLNINLLSKSLRSLYIPGESFAIRIIQDGKDANQGVGYLDDGTMVVVENGRHYMDRVIEVRVTKLIERDAGRMIFAMPDSEARKVTNPS